MNSFKIWFTASRPKTLLAAFVPVIVGGSLAMADAKFDISVTVVALLCAILIQMGTNFTNDLYDTLKGADTKERVGPLRVIAAGLVTVSQMKTAIIITFGLAFFFGLYIVNIHGLPILMLGIVSIIAGLMYTAGPFPLAYNGLGDLFVFLFFGFAGTTGTYFINTGEISLLSIITGFPVGALITNILVVNNYRDIQQDKLAGKNTLAVIFGEKFALYEYVTFIVFSFIVPLIIYLSYNVSLWIFLPYLTLPFAYKILIMLFTLKGEQLNKALELTAKLSLIFGVLLSLGFIL